MSYLIKFNEDGKKGETYPIDGTMTAEQRENLINQGFIETSEEDFILYCGQMDFENLRIIEYVRDPRTGEPVIARPRTLSKEERAKILFNDCQSDLKAIHQEILIALGDDDGEYLAELREEKELRVLEYEEALSELERE